MAETALFFVQVAFRAFSFFMACRTGLVVFLECLVDLKMTLLIEAAGLHLLHIMAPDAAVVLMAAQAGLFEEANMFVMVECYKFAFFIRGFIDYPGRFFQVGMTLAGCAPDCLGLFLNPCSALG